MKRYNVELKFVGGMAQGVVEENTKFGEYVRYDDVILALRVAASALNQIRQGKGDMASEAEAAHKIVDEVLR